ncbi:MAG: tetratricopeptide repeat protein [Verrucomicrobiales bacterium]
MAVVAVLVGTTYLGGRLRSEVPTGIERNDPSQRLVSAPGAPSAPAGEEDLLGKAAVLAEGEDIAGAMKALSALMESGPPPLADMARLRSAEIFLSTGRPVDAEKVLSSALPGPERSLLLARAALAQGRVDEALRLSEGTISEPVQSESMRVSANILYARIKAAMGQTAEAARALVEFVQAHPATAHATSLLLTLHEIGGLSLEGVEKLLQQWAASPHPPLAAAGTFAAGLAHHAAGRADAAAESFRQFLEKNPRGSLSLEARRRLIQIALIKEDAAAARQVLASLSTEARTPAWQARAEFLAGRIDHMTGDLTQAAHHFQKAAQLCPEPDAALVAQRNAAIAAIQANDNRGLDEWLEPLKVDADIYARVLLDRGLFEAATGDRKAMASLETCLAAPANDALKTQAHLGLAELALDRSPPNIAAARQHAAAASKLDSGSAADRLAWLAVWIEQRDGKLAAAVGKGQQFLSRFQDSPWRVAVHLKLGELSGQSGNWAAAVSQYLALAGEQDDDTALEARALYLAGMAEANIPSPDSLDRAIDLWQDAAKTDESVIFAARFRQALAKARLGHTNEALKQLEGLLSTIPPPAPAQRQAVFYARGELLLRPADKLPPRPAEAEAAFHAVARDADAPAAVRTQALCRKGDCLRVQNRTSEALGAYLEAASAAIGPIDQRATENEMTWPLRAAFSALALYEQDQDWKGALELASTLSELSGPAGRTARERANRLRLEHFVWED